MLPPLPRYIALMGNPTCGKSTAADLICELYPARYELIDDGYPMRDFAIRHFGATWDDVHTQDGKLRKTTINGAEMEWRQALGWIGNGLEQIFGGNVIPEMAYARSDREFGRGIFGSVRREQGLYHRQRGAIVIELANPLAPPSPYEFDQYNAKHAHITVDNNGLANGLNNAQARADLKAKLKAVLENAHSMVRGLAV